jgi:hypothetical protein
MHGQIQGAGQKPRELRRRVMLRARLRALTGWSDGCILNVSSHGLLINAPASAVAGDVIELWHGEHVIIASIIWRKGTRAGLRSDDRIPVEDIMALSRAPMLQLTAQQWPSADRRKRPRQRRDSRLVGRAMEFAGLAVAAILLAGGALAMVEAAFARPLAAVRSALGG